MTRFLPFALCLSSSLLAVPAWSQSNEKVSAPQTESLAVDDAATSPQKVPAQIQYTDRRRQALLDYNLGEVDQALADLRALVTTCDENGPKACPDSVRADLYVALAIVLAGGKNDVQGAARLFHAALTRDPAVTVPREFATRPVQEAMREANESTSYDELSRPAQPVSEPPAQNRPPAAEDLPPPEEKKAPRDRKTGLVLGHALLGTGLDDVGDAPAIGAAGVLGARFVDSSAWTTAIRGRIALFGIDQEPIGGLSLLMGGSWGANKKKRMGYFLGGLGLDSYGGGGGVSVNGMGGVTLGGFLLGGGVDMGASSYGGFAMMCLHLGWGARL